MSTIRQLCTRIAQYEWLILLMLFPIVIFLERESAFILGVFPVLWVVRWLGNGRFFPATPVNWPLYGLLIMAAISLLVTFDFENSLPMVGGLVLGISLYFALVEFVGRSQKRLYLILGGYVLAGSLVLLIGLLHPTFLNRLSIIQPLSERIPSHLVRFPGDPDGFNAGRISGTLLWVLPLVWVLAMSRGAGVGKLIPRWLVLIFTVGLFGLAGAMSLNLIYLFSRAAQISFLGIMLLFFGMLAWKHRWLIIVGLLLLIAGVIWVGSSEVLQIQAQQWFLTISGETIGGSTAVESIVLRTKIWEPAYYIIREFPVTGTGMNNFPVVMSTYFPVIGLRNTSDITHAHNQILIVGTDLGLPGIIAYLSLLMGIAWMLWQCWRRSPHWGDKMLALGIGASLLAFQMFGISDGIGLGEKPAVFFWFLMGLSGALYYQVLSGFYRSRVTKKTNLR